MKQGKNKRNNTKKALPKRTQEAYSTLYLIILFTVSGFLGLLGFALGESANADIDVVKNSIRNELPYRYKNAMERDLERMVEGHPIAAMVPYISHEDPETAKYLVSIAKKESNWGKYSPKNEYGETCYNYWGYRGQTESVTRSGYSCFKSPKEAVAIVGKRLGYLIWDLRLDTQEELIVWKCGYSCTGHSSYGVNKWIQDVDYYARKIDAERLADAGK